MGATPWPPGRRLDGRLRSGGKATQSNKRRRPCSFVNKRLRWRESGGTVRYYSRYPFSELTERNDAPMGYKQTAQHCYGKGSYHQIGLVRGQFGNVPMDKWLQFLQESGFDGWEEASWELDLGRCGNDSGAEAY